MILDETPDRLGSLTEPAADALADLATRDAVPRLWARDHTLGSDDPTEITDRLDWLTVGADMAAALDRTTTRCSPSRGNVQPPTAAPLRRSPLIYRHPCLLRPS